MECNLENLVSIFQQIEGEGWKTNSELKWGYFFFDKTREKLLDGFKEIEEKGYVMETLFENDDSDWVMQISKIEIHTPESLHNRNQAMNRLAEHCNIELYDGWDVGQIEA